MTLRILVVGAGIAGLSAARALRLAGYRPDVVEELPASMLPAAGIYLPGNALRALRQLGLDAPLRPLGDLIFRQVFLDARGRSLFEMDVAGLWAGVGESRALSRADLQQVLLTGVGGEVRYDTSVRDLEIFDGAAKVEFGDGSVAEYDLVIGPTVGFSPFPWKQLYIDEMDGKKLRNYYHWMATKYFVTLTSNPSVSLPCGVDHKKMPFGLQVIGRFRGDGEVLGAAHAMEQAFKRIPGLARPLPDIARLRKPVPELKSIVTHPPKLNAKPTKGPAPGAL